jgi:2-(1,2-epoxy-1,2-dihydrophenyl)acetyl-CoA isomerase
VAYETFDFEIQDGVARITLNRPDAYNAMSKQMALELMHVSIQCSEDEGIRAVLITGAGKAFCAGGDLTQFAGIKQGLAAHLKEMTTYLHAAMSRFAWMDAPLIAAVNGVAAGAGMSLAAACDLVIAAQSARFTMAYTKAGLTPDGSSTYYLPRIIGFRRTMELALTNRVLSAAEAVEWGIANRVVADADCLAEASALAAELAKGPTRAFGGVKKMLLMSHNDSLEGQLEREARFIAEMAKGADGPEGIAAFCEKRAPEFIGR